MKSDVLTSELIKILEEPKPQKMREYVVEYHSASSNCKLTLFVYANGYSSARHIAENALSKGDCVLCIGEK